MRFNLSEGIHIDPALKLNQASRKNIFRIDVLNDTPHAREKWALAELVELTVRVLCVPDQENPGLLENKLVSR